jgi:predicted Zn-dependent protease
MNPASFRLSRVIALLGAIAFVTFAASRGVASPVISPEERNWELQIGRQAYAAYAQRGNIVPRQSQLYGILDPIANAIASVANRQYYAPFRFILLNEAEPNAFSMPGGNVYVTTAMLSYLRNRDELAGVLCHEVNHDIHHDMYNVYEAQRRGEQTIGYERAAETQADRAGAYTCAQAGFNPWGMVWNMRLHRGMSGPQMASASDHPSDDQRLDDLSGLLSRDRTAFGKYRDDIADSAPLSHARVFAQSGYGTTTNNGWYPSQYPAQYPAQYPQQYPPQYGPPMGQYPPPPPPPPCYPGC